jgi:Tfp pilus assembly protein PilN
MLRTNLSTRPFYNERRVHLALGVIAALVVAFAVFNVVEFITLSGREAQLGGDVAAAEARVRQLGDETQRLRRSVNKAELEEVTLEAHGANALIDRRVFSWTRLFTQLETTLPDDVRILSVAPRLDTGGQLTIGLAVVGRRPEDIDAFVEKLEGSGAFAGVLSRQESVNKDGLLEVELEGRYLGPVRATTRAEAR